MTASAAASLPGDHPTKEDAERGLRLVEELISADAAALFARALDVVWATTKRLAQTPGSFGLIHGDLHYENFLFHHVRCARSISTTAAGASISTTSP